MMNLKIHSSLLLLLLSLFLVTSFVSLCLSDNVPQNIHIAYGENADEMTIMFSTEDKGDTVVHYGTSPTNITMKAFGNSVKFTQGNPNGLRWVHKTILTNLIPGQHYWYFVRSEFARSTIYNFTAMPSGNDWVAKFLVLGDMGRHGGAQALPSLISAVQSGYPIAAIHVGDFAYDLDDEGGINGDEFMNRIQPIAGYIPYMVCIGNHEDNHNYSHYRYRFGMPGYETENMWFSWNIQNVHFIAYSTEVYFQESEIYTPEKQYAWLKEDLKKANQNRDQQPWIIAYGHRPFYCSNIDHDDCTHHKGLVRSHLEKLFFENGVDIIIQGHEHSYERLWPTYNETVTQQNYINPLAPVGLITGTAGCNENDGQCVNPIRGPRGPWSAFRASGDHYYGYAHLEVYNSTHIYWDQVLTLENDKILDSIWIVQEKHGPFAPLTKA